MRIVVITTSYPRTADDPSGHFVRSSALALVRQGHEVHVVAPGGSLLDRPRERDGLVIHRAGGGALFAWPGAIARAKEAPWRIFASGELAVGVTARLRALGPVDRAIAHWIVPSAFPLAIAALREPIDVVAHGADVRLLLGAPRAAREYVISALLRRGGHFTFAASASLVALERAIGARLRRDLARASRVEPPAIDVPDVAARAAELRGGLALASDEKLAVTACRLIPGKRVDLAIDAARAIAAEGRKLRLVVVGDGPERAALERRAEGAGGAVTFTGSLARREALAWVAAADALVHPSGVEAAPTAIREARALGVPVIACDAGDVAAWAKDDPGIVVAEPAAEAIAAALGGVARAGR